MIWRKKPTWFFLLVMVAAGCATTMSYDQIMQNAAAVNSSDGIDESEAVLIAQKFLIENGLDNNHDVNRVGEVLKEEDDSAWLVNFSGGVARGASEIRQFGFTQPIIIRVNAADGKAELSE